jgi:hypothetical protein
MLFVIKFSVVFDDFTVWRLILNRGLRFGYFKIKMLILEFHLVGSMKL